MTRVSIALLASGLPISHGGSSGRTSGGCVGGTTVDCYPVGASTNSSVDSRDTASSVGDGCADGGACDAPASRERASSPATLEVSGCATSAASVGVDVAMTSGA